MSDHTVLYVLLDHEGTPYREPHNRAQYVLPWEWVNRMIDGSPYSMTITDCREYHKTIDHTHYTFLTTAVWGESHTSYWLTTFDVLEWLRKARGAFDRSIATIEGQER